MSLQPGVHIHKGPSPWQILQQDENGCASLELSGQWMPRAAEDAERGPHWVDVRLVHESSGAPVSNSLDWTRAQEGSDNTWSLKLQGIPAGGLYRVETRVSRRHLADERPLRGDYIHCLGVGDLWCIAGQSNASGTGAGIIEDEPELGIHLFANDERWKLATHPLEDATGTLHPITVTGIFHGHSPWLAFARALRRRLGIPIGLIPTALGGSPLQRWNPEEPGDADLYLNMMEMISRSGGRVRGIVWYQGESDCSYAQAQTYGVRFRQFIERVRNDLQSPDLPVVAAQLNRVTTYDCRLNPPADCDPTPESRCAWSMVREAQRQAARDIPSVYVVPTLDLSLSDSIHNSAPAEVVLGERFAQVALGKVYGRNALDTFPEVSEARLVAGSPTEIRAVFRNVAGGWCVLGTVEDFQVEDDKGWVQIRQVELGEEGEVRIHLSRTPEGKVLLHASYGTNPVVRLIDSNRRPMVAFSMAVLGE